MDWQFKVGLGAALVFGFLQFAVKTVPSTVTWPGIAIGILFILWGLLPHHDRLPHGPSFLFIAGVATVTASVAWYLTRENDNHDFENVATWSVSFKIGGLWASGPLDFNQNISAYVIGLPECRFYNLSTTQRRMIDLTLNIPTKDTSDPLGSSIKLTTQTLDFGFKRMPTPGIIDLPIVLEPSSSLEGRVDFVVPQDIKDRIFRESFKWLKFEDAIVDVTEHRSGKTIKIRVGESYDAATDIIRKP